MTTTTSISFNMPEFNMTEEEVENYVTGLVGGIVEGPVDTEVYLNGAPHTVHVLHRAALQFVKGSRDERGVVTLYWVGEVTPEELGVTTPIKGVEGISKPRVVSASSVYETRGGVPVAITSGERIEGLPSIPDGVSLISSGITASAAARLGLTNILAPGAQVRSLPTEGGRSLVLGCFGFLQGS